MLIRKVAVCQSESHTIVCLAHDNSFISFYTSISEPPLLTVDLASPQKQLPVAISQLCFNSSGSLLAVSFQNQKILKIYGVVFSNSSISMTPEVVVSLDKSLTAMMFYGNGDSTALFYADKFGDLRRLPIFQAPDNYGLNVSKPELLLGHVSMITALSIQDSIIYTCDRDEKVRRSYLESPFVIKDFLLGHSEYISTCTWLKHPNFDEKILLTAGGDSYLCIWHNLQAEPVGIEHVPQVISFSTFLPSALDSYNVLQLVAYSVSQFLIVFEERPGTIFLCQLSFSNENFAISGCSTLQIPSASDDASITVVDVARLADSKFLFNAYCPQTGQCDLFLADLTLPDSWEHVRPDSFLQPSASVNIPLAEWALKKSTLRKYITSQANDSSDENDSLADVKRTKKVASVV